MALRYNFEEFKFSGWCFERRKWNGFFELKVCISLRAGIVYSTTLAKMLLYLHHHLAHEILPPFKTDKNFQKKN